MLDIDGREFFVKYARPHFGAITNGTEVKINQNMPKNIRTVRIAPIWPTNEEFKQAQANKDETKQLLKTEILMPYFFCGLMCYLEKGETLKIAGKEFFINDCQPRTGIINKETIINVELGFQQEVFQRKQVLADQRLAEKLQNSGSSH